MNDRFVPATEPALVARVVAAALSYLERPAMPVSLLLTDDAEIGKIHDRFLGDPSPTDVISFPLDDGVDIVVSVERAHSQARERGHDASAELALYLIHGLLHVCGYDDVDSQDRQRMRVAEREILTRLELFVDDVDVN